MTSVDTLEEFERIAQEGAVLCFEKPDEARPLLEGAYRLARRLGLEHEAGMVAVLLARQAYTSKRYASAIHILRHATRAHSRDKSVAQSFAYVLEYIAERMLARGHVARGVVLLDSAAIGETRWAEMESGPERERHLACAEGLSRRARELRTG